MLRYCRQISCQFAPGRLLWILVLFAVDRTDILARPAAVILLRHAEKPLDHKDVHLTSRGRERALALAEWFTTNNVITNLPPIVTLIATEPTRHEHSVRPRETLEPLSNRLHRRIETKYPADEFRALARSILNSPEYDGKTVVVCWVHDELASLAAALGVKPTPNSWKGPVYDRIWVVQWTKTKAKLKDIPQRLLPGDSIE